MNIEQQSSFEPKINPDSAFGKGDIIEKLEILLNNREIDKDYAEKHEGETPPAQEEVDAINKRMEEELLKALRESGEELIKELKPERKKELVRFANSYLEYVENDELRRELEKIKTELLEE